MPTILDFHIRLKSGESYSLEVFARGQSQPLATATFDFPLSLAGFGLIWNNQGLKLMLETRGLKHDQELSCQNG